MEKENAAAPATERPEKKENRGKKRPKRLRRILAGVLTLLLIALAVLVFVFRDHLSDERLREAFGRQSTVFEPVDETFAYESGSDQVFAAAGNGLAVASGSAVQLLNAAGETVWKQIVSYGAPAVFASEECALFCDIGGRAAVCVTMEGESAAVETNDTIISASMNENGWFVLVTEAVGYKSLVRVYNAARELQYEWWSGSGYVLRAAVSPDNRRLGVLTADSAGAKLHLFSLSSETELAAAEFPRELVFDLSFLDNDTVCCLSETALHFVGTDGAERGKYELGSYYLMDYDFGGEGFVSLFVSAYRAGTGGLVLNVDSGGLLGCAELSRSVTSLSARGKQLLVMTGGDIALYAQDMARQSYEETLMTAKRAILQPNGDILLLSAYAAEQFRF